MTILESLRHISLYPLNPNTVGTYCIECDLNGDSPFSQEVARSKQYIKAKAKVFFYLADAPTVTEAGTTYSFTAEQRKRFRKEGESLLASIGEDEGVIVDCGYIGEDF